jgi:hypothetical protein
MPKQKPDYLFDVPIIKRVKWGETIVGLGYAGNSIGNLAVFWYFIRDPFHFREYFVSVFNFKSAPAYIDKLKIVVDN